MDRAEVLVSLDRRERHFYHIWSNSIIENADRRSPHVGGYSEIHVDLVLFFLNNATITVSSKASSSEFSTSAGKTVADAGSRTLRRIYKVALHCMGWLVSGEDAIPESSSSVFGFSIRAVLGSYMAFSARPRTKSIALPAVRAVVRLSGRWGSALALTSIQGAQVEVAEWTLSLQFQFAVFIWPVARA